MDNATLLYTVIITPGIFVLLTFPAAVKREQQTMLQTWVTNLFWALGFSLLLFQGIWPPLLTIIAANTIIYAGFLSAAAVNLRLYQITPSIKLYGSLLAIHFSLFLIFTYPIFNTLIRVIIIAAEISMVYLITAVYLLRRNRTEQTPLVDPIIVASLFYTLANIVRIGMSLTLSLNMKTIFSGDTATAIVFLATILFFISWNLAIQLKQNQIYRNDLWTSHSALQRAQQDISLLNSFYQEGRGEKDDEELYQRIFTILEERFDIHKMVILTKEENRQTLMLKASYGIDTALREALSSLHEWKSLSGRVMQTGKPVQISLRDYTHEPLRSLLLERNYTGVAAFPLSTGLENIGTLSLGMEKQTVLPPQDIEVFQIICNQLGTLIFNYILLEKLEHLATTDSLTEMANRREIMRRLRSETASAERYGNPLTLFIIDIDSFKKINDTYGHQTGDSVLIALSRLLKDQIRETDVIGRYGGEEFIGILPHTDLTEAEQGFQRLLKAIRGMHISSVPDLSITVSLGGTAFRKGDSGERMIARADAALYDVKRSGKDNMKISR